MSDKRKATEQDREDFESRLSSDPHWDEYFHPPHAHYADGSYSDSELNMLWEGYCLGKGIQS